MMRSSVPSNKEEGWTRIYSLPLSVAMVALAAILFYTLYVDYIALDYTHQVLVKYIVLRGIALCSTFAFYSLAIQIKGLLGNKGLVPISQTLETLKEFFDTKDDNDENANVSILSYFSIQTILQLFSLDTTRRCLLRLVYEKFHIETLGHHSKRDKDEITNHLTKVVYIDVFLSFVTVLYPHPILFLYLYFSYYSYKRVSGPFLNFQWDVLLLECLFISIPLSLSTTPILIMISMWLVKILLFRLMFGSGMVKGYGRDESWYKSLDAMAYHFMTQPLPNRLGRWIYLNLTAKHMRWITMATLVLEIVCPLMTLCGSELFNVVVAIGYILLQGGISASGSFGFFNYLTIVLSMALFNDDQLHTLLSLILTSKHHKTFRDVMHVIPRISHSVTNNVDKQLAAELSNQFWFSLPSLWRTFGNTVAVVIVIPIAILVTISNYTALLKLLQRCRWVRESPSLGDNEQQGKEINGFAKLEEIFNFIYEYLCCSLHEYLSGLLYLGNHYGLFANMTKVRNEIRFEMAYASSYRRRVTESSTGSHLNRGRFDKRGNAPTSIPEEDWEVVQFHYKPDDVFAEPKQVYPMFHMPRLDWMMWFMAFKPSVSAYPKWMWNFLLSLLDGNEDVLALLPESTRKMISKQHFLIETLRSMREEEEKKEKERVESLKSKDQQTLLQGKNERVAEILKNSENRLEDSETNADTDGGKSSTKQHKDHVYLRLRFFKYDFYREGSAAPLAEVNTMNAPGFDGGNSEIDAAKDSEGEDFVWNGNSSSSKASSTTNDIQKSQYWTADYIGTLLSPVNLDELYEFYDSQFNDKINAAKSRRGGKSKTDPPKTETPQEIILRTLFRNAQRKKNKTGKTDDKQE